MHALIVDLDLTLLAGEAGLVKEQLLRPHHLGLISKRTRTERSV